MADIALTELQASAIEIYVTDPAHDEDEDRVPVRLEGQRLRYVDEQSELIARRLTDILNGLDEEAEGKGLGASDRAEARRYRDALTSIVSKIRKTAHLARYRHKKRADATFHKLLHGKDKAVADAWNAFAAAHMGDEALKAKILQDRALYDAATGAETVPGRRAAIKAFLAKYDRPASEAMPKGAEMAKYHAAFEGALGYPPAQPARPRWSKVRAGGFSDPRLPPVNTIIEKSDRDGKVRASCTVVAGGIAYNGKTYTSLSAAAMAAMRDLGLTAKAVNGFAWWGLKDGGKRARSTAPVVTDTPAPAAPSGESPRRAWFLRLARQDGDRAASDVQSWSGADQAESEFYRLRRLLWVALADGATAESALADLRTRWAAYAKENNARVAGAPKIKRGPSSGHSVISHRWVSPSKVDESIPHIMSMARSAPADGAGKSRAKPTMPRRARPRVRLVVGRKLAGRGKRRHRNETPAYGQRTRRRSDLPRLAARINRLLGEV